MLIRAFGQFWNPEIIEWGKQGPSNKGQLLGDVRIGTKYVTIDFWEAKGIYVLFDRFKCVYVGKALESSIGFRLRSHLSDRFAGRWDMFTFFSVSTVNKIKKNTRDPGQRQVTKGTTINTLEALAILVADPNLNRKRERFQDAHEATQTKQANPRTERNYYEEIIKRLDKMNNPVKTPTVVTPTKKAGTTKEKETGTTKEESITAHNE